MANLPVDDLIDVTEKQIEKKSQDFSKLLLEIDNLPDKMRALWRETYENALADRHNAFLMFRTLAGITGVSSSEMAIHGRTLATFLEKMSKANDQLLKLSEIIAKQTKPAEGEDEDIYKRLERETK